MMFIICTVGSYHEVCPHQNFIILSKIFVSLISLLQKSVNRAYASSKPGTGLGTVLYPVRQCTAPAQKQAFIQQFLYFPQNHRDGHVASQADMKVTNRKKLEAPNALIFVISFRR